MQLIFLIRSPINSKGHNIMGYSDFFFFDFMVDSGFSFLDFTVDFGFRFWTFRWLLDLMDLYFHFFGSSLKIGIFGF